MKRDGQKILLCDCERSVALDGKTICRALAGDGEARVHTQLCRAEIEAFRDAISNERGVLVACTQEAPLFAETAAELSAEVDLKFTNIRETAGWSAAGTEAGPKIAALLADKQARTPLEQKIDSQLLFEQKMQSGVPIANGIWTLETDVPYAGDGHIVVDVRARSGSGAPARLAQAGFEIE